jgi:hypothetical protein
MSTTTTPVTEPPRRATLSLPAGGPAPRRFVNVVIPVLTNVGAWSRTDVL